MGHQYKRQAQFLNQPCTLRHPIPKQWKYGNATEICCEAIYSDICWAASIEGGYTVTKSTVAQFCEYKSRLNHIYDDKVDMDCVFIKCDVFRSRNYTGTGVY